LSPDFKKNQNAILFKVQGFFAKLRKNLAPEQFKSLHQHARVKVLLNCSAGININRKPTFVGKADKCRLVLCVVIFSSVFSSETVIGEKREKKKETAIIYR